jgi:hypothetical protein
VIFPAEDSNASVWQGSMFGSRYAAPQEDLFGCLSFQPAATKSAAPAEVSRPQQVSARACICSPVTG